MKTTNYFATLIEVAEDCPVQAAEVPPQRGDDKTVARIQYELIKDTPYQYTSDDVVFHVFAVKNDIDQNDLPAARETFFSKGQPCLRASPLTKRYGWGVHSDSQGRIAILPVQSEEYAAFINDKGTTCLKAMRSKRG